MRTLTNMPGQVFCTDRDDLLIGEKPIIGNQPVINKPTTGLWTSSVYSDSQYVSAWQEWCSGSDFPCGKHHFLIHPKQNIKVFEPTKFSDLRLAENKMPAPLPPTIDFAWYAEQGYDGFHISTSGLWIHKGLFYPFQTWDCESTCWFNYDWIDTVEKIR